MADRSATGTMQAATALTVGAFVVQVDVTGTPQALTAITVGVVRDGDKTALGAMQASPAVLTMVGGPIQTVTLQQAIFSAETGEAFIILLTITHPDLPAPLRVTNDGVDVTSRSNLYQSCPFQLTLPIEDHTRAPRAQLQIDNVDRVMVQSLRSITTAPTILIEIVMSSALDVVESSVPDFTLSNVNYDALIISGDLTLEDFLQEPYPAGVFDPGRFPGVF